MQLSTIHNYVISLTATADLHKSDFESSITDAHVERTEVFDNSKDVHMHTYIDISLVHF